MPRFAANLILEAAVQLRIRGAQMARNREMLAAGARQINAFDMYQPHQFDNGAWHIAAAFIP